MSQNLGRHFDIYFRHAKDVLLLTAIIQGLALISNYFWLLWLIVSTFVYCFAVITKLESKKSALRVAFIPDKSLHYFCSSNSILQFS